jgi:hypothetical protein
VDVGLVRRHVGLVRRLGGDTEPTPTFSDKAGQICSGVSPDKQGPILGDPGCTSGSDITWLIADQDRIRQVEVEVACRGKHQTRLWFATLAISLRQIGRQRMVGTCVYSVEDDPTFSERGEKKGVDNHDVGLGGPAIANASLIGNNNQCSTDRLSGGRCIQGEVDWLEIARLDDVAVDNPPIQNPVAVQEQRRSRRRTSFTSYVTEHESTFLRVPTETGHAMLEASRGCPTT